MEGCGTEITSERSMNPYDTKSSINYIHEVQTQIRTHMHAPSSPVLCRKEINLIRILQGFFYLFAIKD